jgi:spermidine synthase
MFKKLISFVFPFTRIIRSEYNGRLELTTSFGKTYLNSANTNYSYGSLQKVLKFSLKQIDVSGVNHILVLGLGGGSVLKTLRKDFKYAGKITAVDIDPVIIEIAGREFGVMEDKNTVIVCADALDYLSGNDEKAGIVIIDLFIDNTIPSRFLSAAFWDEVINSLTKEGTIIFNMLSVPEEDLQKIEQKLAEHGFSLKIFRKVMKTNNVLIAGRKDTCGDTSA